MNNTGRVLQVIGPVIDVEFLPEHLPALIAMLQEVQRRIEAGDAL